MHAAHVRRLGRPGRAAGALLIALVIAVAGCNRRGPGRAPTVIPPHRPHAAPTIDPYADEAQAAKAAFAALIAKPGLSYHLEQEMSSVQRGPDADSASCST